jgi:hypothetical protein
MKLLKEESSVSIYIGLVLLVDMEMLVFFEGGVKSEHHVQRLY